MISFEELFLVGEMGDGSHFLLFPNVIERKV